MKTVLLLVLLLPSIVLSRPNIIVIFTDDQGYADLGCQGVDDAVRTPHLDALAARGIRCTSGFVTAPQCKPSRVGILCGVQQQKAGVETNTAGQLRAGIPTIASRLREAGYHTAAVGKWGVGGAPNWQDIRSGKIPAPDPAEAPWQPAARGFEDYFSGVQTLYLTNLDLKGQPRPGAPAIIREDRYRLEVQNEVAAGFIDRAATLEKPFFLYFAPYAPHVPLTAPEKYQARFPEVRDKERRTCLAMMSCLDDGVGAILEALRRHQLEQKTLIFFISDNGAPRNNGSSNAPFLGYKGTLLDGGVRVPFLVAWPGSLPAGTTYEPMVSSLDVLPTCLAAAGVRPPQDELDGVNLLPHFKGEAEGPPREHLFFAWNGRAAVRGKEWKLVRRGGRNQLFSLVVPAAEERDVSADHPEIVARLSAKLEAWLQTLPKIEAPPPRKGKQRRKAASP